MTSDFDRQAMTVADQNRLRVLDRGLAFGRKAWVTGSRRGAQAASVPSCCQAGRNPPSYHVYEFPDGVLRHSG